MTYSTKGLGASAERGKQKTKIQKSFHKLQKIDYIKVWGETAVAE